MEGINHKHLSFCISEIQSYFEPLISHKKGTTGKACLKYVNNHAWSSAFFAQYIFSFLDPVSSLSPIQIAVMAIFIVLSIT
jgi:hypothetical protein